ncbi:DUF6875 domain-containing protein [Leptothoe sp. PORK10 BA2]|uniref:DUF6875 domain-containing protein n=1 Tax=Leptothoe sp. PORK10 BA2 TaxID=3110254 RepID=UPI002B2187D2|nr:hypothetical protein [Leptothoe sp. PORK10 BA2]MEA5464329.1 hypothetical protein [Leptothoe sp. PORK10 BA2]
MHWVTLGELREGSVESSALLKTAQWIEDFTAKPNKNLGRSGVVCPFIPRSLKLETIQLVEISALGMSQSELEGVIKDCRETFLQQVPRQGKLSLYKALIFVFSDITHDQCDYIDRIQQRLKPFFVEKRLMLGEFYPGNQSPGLHNPDFRPLQSPVPMLVIRSMTEPDLPFLSRTTDAPAVRVKFLESYLRQMAIMGHSSRLTEAYQALGEAQQDVIRRRQSEPMSKCPVTRLDRAIRQKVFEVSCWLRIGAITHGLNRMLSRLLGLLPGVSVHF